jgi:hypothetical protein
LTAEVDGSITNELQSLSISGNIISLSDGGSVTLPASTSFSGSFSDLMDVPANLDTDQTDDFDGDFTKLTNIPFGLSDGDDNTQLSEAQVISYVSNNGYLTSVDGADIDLGSDTAGDLMYYDGSNWVRLPKGDEGQVLTIVGGIPAWANAGIVSSNNVVVKSAAYSMLPTDGTLISNASTDGVVFSLPSAATAGEGKIIHFYAITNKAVLERNGSDQIYNDSGVVTISVDLYLGVFVSDGVNLWYQIKWIN